MAQATDRHPMHAKLRALRPDDLESVIAIDAANVGRRRRGFFENRVDAVRGDPELFITLAVEYEDALAGFLIARIICGEFGISAPIASIDTIGVTPKLQGKGLGSTLLAGLEAVACERGISEVMSQELWTGSALMGFFASAGFEVAPRWVIERGLREPIDF